MTALESWRALPLEFWIAGIAMLGVLVLGWSRRREGWGLPLMAVAATVGAWYLGDAVYNEYGVNHAVQFEPDVLAAAWWQVTGFLAALVLLCPWVHSWMNTSMAGRESLAARLVAGEVPLQSMQAGMRTALGVTAFLWTVVFVVALFRTSGNVLGLIAPYLGVAATPWARGRFGGGFDAIWSLFAVLDQLFAAVFGLAAVLLPSGRWRWVAFVLMAVTWPAHFLQRTRNRILAVALPAVLGLVFVRMRGRTLAQLALLTGAFVAVDGWMRFVLESRNKGGIAAIFASQTPIAEHSSSEEERQKHLGLDMFSELAHINTFLQRGSYEPSWGKRYFAEAVNIIPRGLWPGKPEVGLDYARVRGFGRGVDGDVDASISTGMIGGGLVNFGPWFGPLAAAALMAVWVALLARLDLQGLKPGRLFLYMVGLVLTFNLGRDITLLVGYPIFFGWLGLLFMERTRLVSRSAEHGMEPPSVARMPVGSGQMDRTTRLGRVSGVAPSTRL